MVNSRHLRCLHCGFLETIKRGCRKGYTAIIVSNVGAILRIVGRTFRIKRERRSYKSQSRLVRRIVNSHSRGFAISLPLDSLYKKSKEREHGMKNTQFS